MAVDEARAQRIRELKERHPDMTWGYIADYCGVSPRAAASWGKEGGIAYPNAKKLTELFREHGEDVDVQYIWAGPRQQTPDLSLVKPDDDDRLARIQDRLEKLELAVEHQNENLQEQTTLLAKIREERATIVTALQNIEALIATIPTPQEVAELRRAIDGNG